MRAVVDLSTYIYANYSIFKKTGREVEPSALASAVENNIHNSIIKLQRQVPIKSIVLALDSEPVRRKELYPAYKANRVDPLHKEEVYKYLELPTIREVGLEADDLLYLYSKKYPGTTIVTEDRDMIQALDLPDTRIYFYKSDKLVSSADLNYSYETFKKVVLGCKSDNVPKAVHITEARLDKIFYQASTGSTQKAADVLALLEGLNYSVDYEQIEMNKKLVLFSEIPNIELINL